METDWAKTAPRLIKASASAVCSARRSTPCIRPGTRQVRIRLERSPEPGMTEIYISHRGMEEVYTFQQGDADTAGSRVCRTPNSKWKCCGG